MGYNASGWGTLTIETRLMPDILAKWGTLLNTPVAPDKCKCRLSQWRGEIKLCSGSHKTLYENEYFYDGGETLEQYSAYSFEDIAELFGYELDSSWAKNEGDVLNYILAYEEQKWHGNNVDSFLKLLEGFCKEGDDLNFEGEDEEYWMYLYKDGTFTSHDAVVQILYPSAYEKDARIIEILREEATN